MTRPPCCRAAAALAMSAALSTAAGYTAGPAAVLLLGLAGLVDELVGVAADRLVEDDLLVVVGGVAQHVALAFEDKARIGHLLLDDRRVDAVQGVAVARARNGDDFAGVAARVGVTVGAPALVGDRGGDGRRDRRGGCGHGDDGGGAGGQKQGFHGLLPVKLKLRAKAPAGSPPCQWA